MHQRGVHLENPGVEPPGAGLERFTVDVHVRSSTGAHGHTGRVEIHGANGTHDEREVDAERCEELHSVIAWVLVVLARGPRASGGHDRTSGGTTESANGLLLSGPVAAAGNTPSSVALAVGANAEFGRIPSKVQLAYGRVVPRAQPRFTLGAQLMGGWGFLEQPAWGPALFFEHRPLRGSRFKLRLTLLAITNQGASSDSSIGVSVRRVAARLGASLPVPNTPFALTSGLEGGLLSARGSGAVVSQQSRSAWGSWFAGILLDLPLLRDRLWLEASADASLSPFMYAFRTSSERTIVESGPVELRTAAGLKSSF
jgi:hypothetical protein